MLLRKHGVSVVLAFRPSAHLEPYFLYDFIKLDARLQRGPLGCAIYPLPNERATNRLRLKSEVGYEFPEDKGKVLVWFFQLTTGF